MPATIQTSHSTEKAGRASSLANNNRESRCTLPHPGEAGSCLGPGTRLNTVSGSLGASILVRAPEEKIVGEEGGMSGIRP